MSLGAGWTLKSQENWAGWEGIPRSIMKNPANFGTKVSREASKEDIQFLKVEEPHVSE